MKEQSETGVENTLWESHVNNLRGQFPDIDQKTIETAMEANDGHTGHAASDLRKGVTGDLRRPPQQQESLNFAHLEGELEKCKQDSRTKKAAIDNLIANSPLLLEKVEQLKASRQESHDLPMVWWVW